MAIERISLNFAPFAALLAPQAELSRASARRAEGAADAQGPFPARQPARSSTASSFRAGSGGSSSTSAGATCRASESPLWPPRRTCRSAAATGMSRSRRRLIEHRCGTGRGDERLVAVLSRPRSAAALNWGFFTQHGAASSLPPLHRPAGRCARSGCSSRTSAGSPVSSPGSAVGGSTSWRLTLAPLSLVQAVSAGGNRSARSARGTDDRGDLSRREWTGVGVSLVGLAAARHLARRTHRDRSARLRRRGRPLDRRLARRPRRSPRPVVPRRSGLRHRRGRPLRGR